MSRVYCSSQDGGALEVRYTDNVRSGGKYRYVRSGKQVFCCHSVEFLKKTSLFC